MPKKIPKPDRDWLAHQYLLSPEGLGRSTRDIGRELGVEKSTIQRWARHFGFAQDNATRLSAWRKGRPTWSKEQPPRKWLAEQYLMPPQGRGRSLDDIAAELGISRPTITIWIERHGLAQTFSERHSKRMSGAGNPAYTNGNDQKYVRRKLAKAKTQICEWCGTRKRLHVHHIDHNRENNDLSNLMWLCINCNLMESHFWALQKAGRATFHVVPEKHQIVIKFTNHKEE